MKLMVFDVGGTEIKYSVMDESLERKCSGSVPTPMDSREEFFDVLCGLFEPHRGEVNGIAMSLPALSTARTESAGEEAPSATTTEKKSHGRSPRGSEYPCT